MRLSYSRLILVIFSQGPRRPVPYTKQTGLSNELVTYVAKNQWVYTNTRDDDKAIRSA